MRIDEGEEAVLKTWIVKKLEHISDADSDVLADYVLALLKSDDPDEQIRKNCLEALPDFLKDNTPQFVDDVFAAIRTKSYLPGYSSTSKLLSPTAPSFNPPSGPSRRRGSSQGLNGSEFQSRKRSYNEREESLPTDGPDPHYNRGDRNFKQMRRGGRAQDGFGGRNSQRGQLRGQMSPMGAMPGQASMPQMPGLPQMPTPPPGFPSFDQNNPLAAMMALTAMGFPNMPGMPPFSPSQSPYQPNTRRPMPPKKPGQRCRDYETKGFCVRGVSCPYEHGNDHLVIPGPNATEEYDPANAVISNFANGASPTRTSNRGGLRNDRARGGRGVDRGGRAAFSMTGPNRDRSKTTIVVEQIPEEHFTEEAVRGVFGEFGNILEVDMQPYKRLATVKYDDYYSAKAAWESPKTIFDNRFVKVYWYKPEEQQTPSSAPVKATNGTSTGASKAADGADQKENDDEDIDMADFTAKQAEAQKVHEEKMKKLKEAEDQKEKLAKQQREQAEERRKLLEKLRLKEQAKASAGPGTEAGDGTTETNGTPVDKKKAATEALKAKLAELEAEAESMGLNPDEPPSDPWSSPFRGRGRRAYRGRGTYAPRGRGFDPYRGGYSYRGRGGNPYGGVGRGAVMRLDNRPKRVSVTLAGEGEEWNGDADEALKLYLMNNFEFESVEPHPDRKETQIVAFKERYQAENFLTNSAVISGIGKVELAWAPNALIIGAMATTNAAPDPIAATAAAGEADVAMSEAKDTQPARREKKEDVNEEVADDDDRWMDVA